MVLNDSNCQKVSQENWNCKSREENDCGINLLLSDDHLNSLQVPQPSEGTGLKQNNVIA